MLQELLRGVRDRVVVAVTFLAMLELMKRREIVVEQQEPWGPIVVRRTHRRGARCGRALGAVARRGTAGRDAGGLRVSGAGIAGPSRARWPTTRAPTSRSDRRAPEAGDEAAAGDGEPPARRADRDPARGAPVRRREAALAAARSRVLAGVDRATVDERLGDLEVSLAGRGIRLVLVGDRVELATAPEAGALVARYVGADAVRLSPAALETLAIVAYRQPVTRAAIERIRGVDSDYTVRALLHRRLVVGAGPLRGAGPPDPVRHRASSSSSGSGSPSLDDLPPLDLEVAARLVDGDAAEPSAGRAAAGAGGALTADTTPSA